jgi:hypothetical protein
MYCIKLINNKTNGIVYWSVKGCIRTMSKEKAMYIAARLIGDTCGTAWVVEVVPVEVAVCA